MKDFYKNNKLSILGSICGILAIIIFVAIISPSEVGETTETTAISDETTTSVEEETTANVLENETETVAEPQTTQIDYEGPTNVTTATFEHTVNLIGCSWGDFIITLEEFELICTTVFCEAGNQDIETQYMVALTILNRYKSGFADSIRDVIYYENAYAVTNWSDFENRGWTEQVEMAVQYALDENYHPLNMYYFRTDYYHTFDGAIDYMQSDDLYFSTSE